MTQSQVEVLDIIVAGGVSKVHHQWHDLSNVSDHRQSFIYVRIQLMYVEKVLVLPDPYTHLPYNKEYKK